MHLAESPQFEFPQMGPSLINLEKASIGLAG
jgi:hypothetical protein